MDFQNIWAWMELFVCNESELSGADTANLLMQVFSDSSRYLVKNIVLLMQHDIHLPKEQYHVAIKPSPVSNASFIFKQSTSCKKRCSTHDSRLGCKQVSLPSHLSQYRPPALD